MTPTWWVESDFKAPNLPLSLRLKGSGCQLKDEDTKVVIRSHKQKDRQYNDDNYLKLHEPRKKPRVNSGGLEGCADPARLLWYLSC